MYNQHNDDKGYYSDYMYTFLTVHTFSHVYIYWLHISDSVHINDSAHFLKVHFLTMHILWLHISDSIHFPCFRDTIHFLTVYMYISGGPMID